MRQSKTYLGLCICAALSSTTLWADQQQETVSTEQQNTEQQVATQDTEQLERISVTATKRKTYLMETPVAVTAFTQEQLTRGGVKELRELTTAIPNTQFVVSGTDSGIQASIRGVRSGNNTETGDPAVGIHIDGIYSPRPQGALALMYDVSQVEVLRGPQGTLFGRNSTGGSINVIPNKPDTTDSYSSVVMGYGKYDHKQFRAMSNLAVNDRFALRFALMADRRDGYIKQDMDVRDINRPDLNDPFLGTPLLADGKPDTDQRENRRVSEKDYYTNSDKWAMRGLARWIPTDAITWDLTLEHFADQSAGELFFKDCEQAKGTVDECTEQQFYANINVPGVMDMTIDSIRSHLNWALNDDWAVDYRFSVAQQERYQLFDEDAGFAADESRSGFNFTHPVLFDRYARTNAEFDSTIHELQATYNSADWKLVTGVFSMREKNKIRFDVELVHGLRHPDLGFHPAAFSYPQDDRRANSDAVFAQADYNLTEDLNLTFGYRQTKDKKIDNGGVGYELVFSDLYYNGDYDPTTQGSIQGSDLTKNMGTYAPLGEVLTAGRRTYHTEEWNKGTWKLGADYRLASDDLLYAFVATGYKAGGFFEDFDICDCGEYSNLPYGPEEVTNFEFGYKGALLDGKMNLSAALFYSDYSDMQVTNNQKVGTRPDGSEKFHNVTTNIGKAELKGLELELDYIPWTNGRISGYVAWLNARVKEIPFEDAYYCAERLEYGQAPCAGVVDISGNSLPYSPDYSSTLSVRHTFELQSGFALEPQLSAHWQSKMYTSLNNYDGAHLSDAQQAYWKVDATVKLMPASGDWYVEAYGSNLTDEYVRNANYFQFRDGFIRSTYNPPRMYGVRFGYDF